MTNAPLLPVAASLIAGAVAGYYWPVGEPCTLAALAAALLTVLLLRRHRRWQSAGLCLCITVAGVHLSGRQLRQVHTPPRSHDLVVVSEPTDKGKTLVMDALTADGRKVRLRTLKGSGLHVGSGLTVARDATPITYYPLYFDSHGYCGEVFAAPGQWAPKAFSLEGLSLVQRARLQLLRLRSRLARRYRAAGLSAEPYAIVAAMTLGDRTALTPQTRDTYAATGASHVLALSGLHLGIIYWFITLLTVGRRWRTAAQAVTILAVWAFAFLTGLAPSIVRAATMLSVYALLSVGYRAHNGVNTLAFTAIVMLLVNPLAVFDLGFQLSFLSVLSILLVHPLLFSLIPLHRLQAHGWLRLLWGMTTLPLAAQAGVAPLLAYHFHQLPAYFLLSNFIVVPEAYLILVGGLLLLCSGAPIVAQGMAATVTLTSRLLAHVAALPGATIGPLHPTPLQTVLLYVVMGCLYVMLRHAVSQLNRRRELTRPFT